MTAGDAFSDFKAVTAIPRGLPAAAYIDDAFYGRECESLLKNSWVFAGFLHAIPEAGWVLPTDVAGQPVILVRQINGSVKGFLNVCRHRCLKLVDRPQKAGKVLTCPYHAWAYGLDGGLRSTPHFGGPNDHDPPALDKSAYGLHPVRTAVWHDWIFVNLSGDAPPIDDHVQPLARRLADIDLDGLIPLATLDFGVVPTNWKALMENFIEPYHVQYVHRTTTDQPLTDHHTVCDGICLGSAVDVAETGGKAEGRNTLAVSSQYLTLFPNFVLGRYFPDQLGVHLNIPAGAGQTKQQRVIYSTTGTNPGPDAVARLQSLWWDVHKEDHDICERLQQGRMASCAADGGVLSPHWEDSVRRFQELVLDGVGG